MSSAAVAAIPIDHARAGPGDGTLTVRVVRDINGNGSYDAAMEVGVAGASVTVTDPSGGTATGTTTAAGTVAVGLGSVTGGKYRVQVAPPVGSVLQSAPAGGDLSSLTEFVDVSGGKNVTVTTGLWNPADYCQANPTLVTACQRGTRKLDGSSNVDDSVRSLATFPFTQRGTTTAPTEIADQGATGTTYGLAYRKQDRRVFSGAFAKRLTNYGPGGPGAVYVTPSGGGATTLFATVPNAGTTAHAQQTNFDGVFYPVPGTQSLGDVDISEDGSELYVVNLNDKKLYVYDATGATGATAVAPKASYAVPSSCAVAGDWRPGALGVRDGTLYVGGICSGASTNALVDMKAVVSTFAGGAFSAPVLTQSLNFSRGQAYSGEQANNHWFPWSDVWADTNGERSHPMPLLTDIGIENNGDLVLDFRDRWGDMGGYQIPEPGGSGQQVETTTGGDLNRACRNVDGTYSWEGTNGCPNNHVPPNGGVNQYPDVVEYYPGENLTESGQSTHMETSQGALALVYGEQRMPVVVMGPTGLRTGGIGWFDRITGLMEAPGHPNGYKLADETTDGWGKANGLGDLEALCDLAPVQIGNRVWFDTDADGVQDGDEPALAGVKVTATPCAGGAVLPVKTTNAKGEYYFSTADGLVADTCYNLVFDYGGVDTAGLPDAPTLGDLAWTKRAAGADRLIDSNVDSAGKAQVTVGKAGSVDHSLDAGVIMTNRLGDFVWVDTNENGVQDAGEPPVPGVKVTLSDGRTTTTGPDGKYEFSNLLDGAYSVCFDVANLPDAVKDYTMTTKDSGGDDAKDSDADAQGCTPTTTLGVGRRKDLTLDMGLVAPPNKLGDYVWVDTNKNGVQDEGEPPVPGVTVTLSDGQTTTTDAQGEYLFSDLSDGTYSVCFAIANLPAAVADYTLTTKDGGDDAKDSDANTAGCTATTTLGVGKREDRTLDAGLVAPPNKVGDYVWVDTNRNGVQDEGEPPVPGVTVTLSDGQTTTTDAQGEYLFSDLSDGTYSVCFAIANLPAAVADYQATTPNAGDDAKDSDVDLATGCTPSVTVGVGQRENLTLDLGLVSPTNRVGDLVWLDTNGNGIQDSGEPTIAELPVYLQDGDGKPIASSKTGPNGKYLFADLEDGSYRVCFGADPVTGLVKGYALTMRDAGSDDSVDSDADQATGCTHVTPLGPGHREDLTLDAGLLPKPPLAYTGASVFGLLGAGLLLLLGGAVLTGATRRREEETA